MTDDVEHAGMELVGRFGTETEQRMPSDALTQLLVRWAELKRDLVAYETGRCVGDHFASLDTSHIHMRALRHQIAEYERAITMLIPQQQSIYTH
jgi:hypothetical protein